MDFIAHTLEYRGPLIDSNLSLRNYRPEDETVYRKHYDTAFRPMRLTLGLSPNCCASSDELSRYAENIFILEDCGSFIGSVSIFDGEIDGLVVAQSCRRQGWGQKLLQFAIARLQKENISPITLHVADWNQGAIALYLKNGFVITQSKIIHR